MPGRPTRLLLVRHGQSEWNAVGRWQGQADPPLTDLGRHQARVAAATVGTAGAVDGVFASDLQRATDTAAIMAAELGVEAVVVDPDLRERDVGEWSGLTRVEIEQRWPGYLTELASGTRVDGVQREVRRPPSYEPDDAVIDRAVAAVGRALESVAGGTGLVVTHGGLIYTLEVYLGASWQRMANLEGRWFVDGETGLRLGDRVMLVDSATVTVPGQL